MHDYFPNYSSNIWFQMLTIQAVEDQLAAQVEALNTENLSLKSEINWLTINSEELKLQNAKLMVRLGTKTSIHIPLIDMYNSISYHVTILLQERLNTQKGQATEDPKKGSSVSTANLLPRVDNSYVTSS